MGKRKSSSAFWRFVFVVYVLTLLWLLFDRHIQWQEGLSYRQQLLNNMSLVPFHTIGSYWKVVAKQEFDSLFFHCLINLAGNVCLFIPIGWLLPKLWPGMRKFSVFFFTCITAVGAVELLQLFSLLGRLDIDDVILNLVGLLTGYALFMIFKKQR